LTLEIRPVEWKGMRFSPREWFGVATALEESNSERGVGLVAFRGKEREKRWCLGFSATLTGRCEGGTSVRLFPEDDGVSAFESG
jgi:hypothetical protein